MEKLSLLFIFLSLLFILSHARTLSNLIADEYKPSESLDTIPTSSSSELVEITPTDESLDHLPIEKSESESSIVVNDLQISNTDDENTIRAIGIIHIHPINRHFRHHVVGLKHNCHHHHGKHMNMVRSYGNDMILSDEKKGFQPFDRSQFFAKPFDKVKDDHELREKYFKKMYYGKGMKIKKDKKKGGFLKKVSKFLDDLF